MSPVFNSLCFHLSRLEKERFQNDAFQMSPLWKLFSNFSVFISVFGRSSVDDRRKRIKKYAFSNENALVGWGLNDKPRVKGCFGCDWYHVTHVKKLWSALTHHSNQIFFFFFSPFLFTNKASFTND